MSPEGTLSIQAAIPPNILDLRNNPDAQALVPLQKRRSAASSQNSLEDVSVLHRITAAMVLRMFIVAQFLLPYIKLFIGHAYRFERKHRVTQRVFSKSINTVDELGKRTVQFTSTICSINDGKVGQAANDMVIWWVRGVTGGIHQGISEGAYILGAERDQRPKTRNSRVG